MGVLVSLPTLPGTSVSFRTPYAAQGPGPTYNTLDEVNGVPVVDIQGADVEETHGNLNMTTVAVYSNMTIVQAIAQWLSGATVVPLSQIFPEGQTQEETLELQKQQFSTSESAATVAALNYLHKPLVPVVASVTEGSAADGTLMVGDIITSINGLSLTSSADVRTAVIMNGLDKAMTVNIERNGQPLSMSITPQESTDVPGVPVLGIGVQVIPADGLTITYNLADIGGPSAGLMFSLAVVDKLSPGDLNGGKIVAGTGTISEDGTVGEIGGIKHKVQAAAGIGAEVFLSPAENCAEAMEARPEGMTILKVSTLSEAIDALNAYNTGGDYPTCDAS